MFEFVMDILESLKEFKIVLEPSITKGYDHSWFDSFSYQSVKPEYPISCFVVSD